jgi:hypothetical protein
MWATAPASAVQSPDDLEDHYAPEETVLHGRPSSGIGPFETRKRGGYTLKLNGLMRNTGKQAGGQLCGYFEYININTSILT